MSCQKTCSCVGSTPQAAAPTRSLLQHRLSADFMFLQVTSTYSGVGSCKGCRVASCSTVVLHGLQQNNLYHHGLRNFCSSAWSTSSPSLFTDLVFCRVVSLTYPHSSLPAAVLFTLSSICYHRDATNISDWNQLYPTSGQLLVSAHGRHSCSPLPTTKTLPPKLNTIVQVEICAPAPEFTRCYLAAN